MGNSSGFFVCGCLVWVQRTFWLLDVGCLVWFGFSGQQFWLFDVGCSAWVQRTFRLFDVGCFVWFGLVWVRFSRQQTTDSSFSEIVWNVDQSDAVQAPGRSG